MQLYLVSPKDQDTEYNSDWFVTADSPEDAGELYRDYCRQNILDAGEISKGKLRVFTVPETAKSKSVIDWNKVKEDYV